MSTELDELPRTWLHFPGVGTFVANAGARDLRRRLIYGEEVSAFPLSARGTAAPAPPDLDDANPVAQQTTRPHTKGH